MNQSELKQIWIKRNDTLENPKWHLSGADRVLEGVIIVFIPFSKIMKRLSFILTVLSLSLTVVNAQHYWLVTCSESGLKGKVHEVVTMTYFPEDSTGLGLKMVVETRLFSPEGFLTNIFESNPGNDYSTEFVYMAPYTAKRDSASAIKLRILR